MNQIFSRFEDRFSALLRTKRTRQQNSRRRSFINLPRLSRLIGSKFLIEDPKRVCRKIIPSIETVLSDLFWDYHSCITIHALQFIHYNARMRTY